MSDDTLEATEVAEPEVVGSGARNNGHYRLVPVVLLVTAIVAVVESWRLDLGELTNPGPGLWPFVVSIAVTVTAAILTMVPDTEAYEKWTRLTTLLVGGVLSLVVFILLFTAIGFVVPAFLLLLLWLRVFGEESWRLALVLAVGGTAVFYVGFAVLLGVPFPDDIVVGTITRLIGM
ncbi:tripartite tricarboxylate transporter TctB family protein [Cryobacterium sp. TMT1-2-2]|uniref:tripartite tricarboxylate transporter TctB family protein n=1 Tax=Cryobacterium sp. TMT1-2-2 TaxID=1259233 RepID=UPI00106D7C3D|nr:tripartite tricarboxylate transporter TctB family protein [Cryobacterium sp. TMT1-2-2]TFD12397.1 tripartite tricarboxylate transporter TctB family protein [Cryobacterium sp. TMT1-2-2]